MNSDHFYRESDSPTSQEKRRMWKHIGQAVHPPTGLRIADRRSFVYGMAAAFLLLFSSYGAYHTVLHVTDTRTPAALRFEEAYRSAIDGFENVLPAAINAADPERSPGISDIQRQRLALIDAAIREMQMDMNRTDLSPLKRSHLRQLYILKLQAMFDIIERGDTRL